MNLRDKILFLRSKHITVQEMAPLLDTTYEELDLFMLHAGLYNGTRARTIASIRFIEWLQQGKTVEDIALLIGCSNKSVGRTLAARGINPTDYNFVVKETVPTP